MPYRSRKYSASLRPQRMDNSDSANIAGGPFVGEFQILGYILLKASDSFYENKDLVGFVLQILDRGRSSTPARLQPL
jgi:hypothetical protein